MLTGFSIIAQRILFLCVALNCALTANFLATAKIISMENNEAFHADSVNSHDEGSQSQNKSHEHKHRHHPNEAAHGHEHKHLNHFSGADAKLLVLATLPTLRLTLGKSMLFTGRHDSDVRHYQHAIDRPPMA
jgi:ABC-type nickel/cobalt efflux system permease component RcnA